MKLDFLLSGEVQLAKGGVKMPVTGLVDKYRKRYDDENMGRQIPYMIYKIGDRRMIHFKIPSRSMKRPI